MKQRLHKATYDTGPTRCCVVASGKQRRTTGPAEQYFARMFKAYSLWGRLSSINRPIHCGVNTEYTKWTFCDARTINFRCQKWSFWDFQITQRRRMTSWRDTHTYDQTRISWSNSSSELLSNKTTIATTTTKPQLLMSYQVTRACSIRHRHVSSVIKDANSRRVNILSGHFVTSELS